MSSMGEATRDLDTLYKNELPHRAASVGLFGIARYALLGAGRKGVIVGEDGWFFSAEEFKKRLLRDIDAAVDRIAEVQRDLDARGIRMVLAPLPAKSDIYAEEVPSLVRGTAMAEAYNAFASALKDQRHRHGGYASGTSGREALRRSLPQVRHTLVPIRGKRRRRKRSRPACRWPASRCVRERDSPMADTGFRSGGDLTKFVTSPDYAPTVGLTLESVPIYRTTVNAAADGADIFGDDTAVRSCWWAPATALTRTGPSPTSCAKSLRADVVNVAKEGTRAGRSDDGTARRRRP